MSDGQPNINWAFGDGGDVEALCEIADRYHKHLDPDGLWREEVGDKGMSDEEMWQYVWDRRESDLEDMACS